MVGLSQKNNKKWQHDLIQSNPIGGEILLYFYSYFFFNQIFAFSVLYSPLVSLCLFMFFYLASLIPPSFFLCFASTMPDIIFSILPCNSFPFPLQHSDRKQLVDITDDDLQPHIHFLSQIYEARHLEGQSRNGRCIFYEQ